MDEIFCGTYLLISIMKNIFSFLAVFCAANLYSNAAIDPRFVTPSSIASLVGTQALWYNPAGLGFLGGSETAAGYLYEFNERGNRHHGGMSIGLNFFDVLTLAGGMNTQIASEDEAKKQLGTDLNGVFGTALRLTEQSSIGFSLLKTHYFLPATSSKAMLSFGWQSRLNSHVAIGGLYQEVHDGFFKAPRLIAGLAFRPFGDMISIGFDGRFSPRSSEWNQGFRFDPVFSLTGIFGGIGASISAEIPGIKEGLSNPVFSASLEFNFAHLGLNLKSIVNHSAGIYGIGGGIRTSSEEWRSLSPRKDLWVQLSIDSQGNIERKRGHIIEQLIGQQTNPLSVLVLLRRIKNDPSIGGVVLSFKGFAFGDARSQEWRDALIALREANKYVVVYLHDPSERDYYIATAANKIFMNINSTLSLHRFQATLVYLADLLAKVGVKAEAIAAGSYKTAPRQLTNSKPQKEEIEIASNILNNFYSDLLEKVSITRNIDQDKLKTIFDGGEVSAQAAKDAGLIDGAINQDELASAINGQENSTLATFVNYQNRRFKSDQWGMTKKIAVIPIVGEIVDGRITPTLLPSMRVLSGADDIVDLIESASVDPSVMGIVVRIDSPGGSAIAGSKINRALVKAQEKKSIVASLSDVAASAGYMIAVGAHHIIAKPNTITGSIGVFSLYFSAQELAQKTGVNSMEISPLKNPGPTFFRALSPVEREQAQKIVNWYYQNFISTVASGLELDQETVKTHAEGRVWLGHEAFARKLVHEMGGFSEAIDSLRLLGEIPNDEELAIEIYTPGQPDSFSFGAKLARYFGLEQNLADLKPLAPLVEPYLKALDSYRLDGVAQARLPFDIIYPKRAE